MHVFMILSTSKNFPNIHLDCCVTHFIGHADCMSSFLDALCEIFDGCTFVERLHLVDDERFQLNCMTEMGNFSCS